jgi:hypothetical protein
VTLQRGRFCLPKTIRTLAGARSISVGVGPIFRWINSDETLFFSVDQTSNLIIFRLGVVSTLLEI